MPKKDATFKVRPNALESTDDAGMYAVFVASVPEVDREGEFIDPMDFDTSEWKKNPVWLWAHDQKLHPIGAGYDPAGNIACWQSKDMLKLGCRFSQANPNGVLTYALYKEGTLKMVSVGYKQLGVERMTREEAKTWGLPSTPMKVIGPELVECSCVPIGMNRKAMLSSIKSWDGYADRDAISSIITKGHFHGEKLTADMVRMLQPLAVPARFKTTAWAKKIPNSSTRFADTRLMSGISAWGAVMAKKAKATETKAAPEPKVKSDPAPDVQFKEMTTTDDTAGATAVIPGSVETMKAAMTHLGEFCKAYTEGLAASDMAEIRDHAKAFCGKIAGLVKEMYDYGVKAFPDYAEQFTEPAGIAAEYALEEDPDAAMSNTEEEEEIQDEAKKDTDTETEDAELAEDEEESESSKGNFPVTVSAFNEWHTKEFGEGANPRDAILGWVREAFPDLESLSDLASTVNEHRTALEDVEAILVQSRR